jgi:glycerophosphoryl diester phosphodiesterase
MVHWDAHAIDHGAVQKAAQGGLLVCSYTTDDELGWCGGAALGFDAMCTNVPARMLDAQRRGLLRRR